jgi:hypothetical protein
MADLTALLPGQQLDFWLGDWDVSWGDGQRGTNRVVRILDGIVIQENFDGHPAMDFKGMSLSVFNARQGVWQQTWADSQGSYWHFTGEVRPDSFIFATVDQIDGKPVHLRMVFFNIEADALDWRWERSDDGGSTWELRWQIRYVRSDRPQG